jgi:NADPH2:quinone reductase
MRAIEFHRHGGPEVLTLTTDAPTPEPAPGQVGIDVEWAGLNYADVLARADGYRVEGFPFRPGLEVAGRVRAVGAGVGGLAPGQRVAALLDGGGYAEVALAEAGNVFPLPDGVDTRAGAALPTVLPTAHALLHETGRLRAGETVLVHGAAGGVGTVAGQLARAAGAGRVLGVVSSPAKAAYAREYGYDEVFVGPGWPDELRRATGGRGADLVLDPVGGDTLRAGLAALAPFGRLVSYGNASGAEPWRVGGPDLIGGNRTVGGFSILHLAHEHPEALRELAERSFQVAAEHGITVPVTAELPLADAAKAHELLGSRASTGKLLLRVAD